MLKQNSLYSNLEELLETAQRSGDGGVAGELFKTTKKELESISSSLKIPKAQRALLAISHVEALIGELLSVGDELAAQTVVRKASKNTISNVR
jgi:hypothetical protein